MGQNSRSCNALLDAISRLLKTGFIWFMFICSINRCDNRDSVLCNACLCNRISLCNGSQEHYYICLLLFSQIDEKAKHTCTVLKFIADFGLPFKLNQFQHSKTFLNSILQHFRKWKLYFPWVILSITKCSSSRNVYCIHKTNAAQ